MSYNISKKLNDAWIKINEGISSAADTISGASKNRIQEIRLEGKKQALNTELVSAIVELYRNGAQLPEEIAQKAAELSGIMQELAALHPAAAAATAADSKKDEDVPVITVDDKNDPVQSEDSSVSAEETAEPEEAEIVYEAEADSVPEQTDDTAAPETPDDISDPEPASESPEAEPQPESAPTECEETAS